jgi:hypothetical protein
MQMMRSKCFTMVLACGAIAIAGCGGGKSKSQTDGAGKSQTGAGSTPASTSQPAGGTQVGAPQYEAKLKEVLSGAGAAGNLPPGSAGPQGPTTDISSVKCPADLKPSQGVSFTCQVTGAQGLNGNVMVTPDDPAGKKFHYKGSLRSSSATQTVSGNSLIQ